MNVVVHEHHHPEDPDPDVRSEPNPICGGNILPSAGKNIKGVPGNRNKRNGEERVRYVLVLADEVPQLDNQPAAARSESPGVEGKAAQENGEVLPGGIKKLRRNIWR